LDRERESFERRGEVSKPSQYTEWLPWWHQQEPKEDGRQGAKRNSSCGGSGTGAVKKSGSNRERGDLGNRDKQVQKSDPKSY